MIIAFRPFACFVFFLFSLSNFDILMAEEEFRQICRQDYRGMIQSSEVKLPISSLKISSRKELLLLNRLQRKSLTLYLKGELDRLDGPGVYDIRMIVYIHSQSKQINGMKVSISTIGRDETLTYYYYDQKGYLILWYEQKENNQDIKVNWVCHGKKNIVKPFLRILADELGEQFDYEGSRFVNQIKMTPQNEMHRNFLAMADKEIRKRKTLNYELDGMEASARLASYQYRILMNDKEVGYVMKVEDATIKQDENGEDASSGIYIYIQKNTMKEVKRVEWSL